MNNISNLLRYSINDTQYQLRVQNATLGARHNLATQETHFSASKLSLHTEQPQIRQDSTDFFASIGLHRMSDLMTDAAERGRQAVLEATANYGRIADQMAQIDKGVTPAQVYSQNRLRQSQTSLVVRSAAPIDISYTPGRVDTQYTPAEVQTDWDVERAIRRYTPSAFKFEVLQAPSLHLTYVGGFQYLPEGLAPSFSRQV